MKKTEIVNLLQDFANTYPKSPQGQKHISFYAEQRLQGCQNFTDIKAAHEKGQDITNDVLLKLLPHTDSIIHQESGAWIHIAPCITGDIKAWYEKSGWTKSENWPNIAQSIFDFITGCLKHPEQLVKACTEFAYLPYNKGLQTGMMTPILNALNPDQFLLVNNKSRSLINYLAKTDFSPKLTDYPSANQTGKKLILELTQELQDTKISELRTEDIFDMFSHWLLSVKKLKLQGTRYWKISPGENAWQWDEALEQGFIALGWNEIGDVSQLSRIEFDNRRDKQIAENPDQKWTKPALNQVWIFSQIKEGDRIIANRGISEVLGIGTVVGDYYFDPENKQSHQLPIRWDDAISRPINERGWRKTLIGITEDKFNQILNVPTIETIPKLNPVNPFTELTFDLIAELHVHPKYITYKAKYNDFQEYLIKPFQHLMQETAKRLPKSISNYLETHNNLFSKIKKNDYRHGGAWDFYWGAFYPRDHKRTESAQLFLWINHERIEFGFFVGVHGKEQRQRFQDNCQKNSEAIALLLSESLVNTNIHFGTRSQSNDEAYNDFKIHSKEDIETALKSLKGYDLHIAQILSKDKVSKLTQEQLITFMVETYEIVFPLVLLAVEENPFPNIEKYLSEYNSELKEKISEITKIVDSQGLSPKSVKELSQTGYSQQNLIDEWTLTPLGQSTQSNHNSKMSGSQESPTLHPAYTLSQCASDLKIEEPILLEYIRALNRKNQAILYGPPGTGKTFMAKKLMNHLLSEGYGFGEVVQFHPAYTYEDFVQGIRPQMINGILDYPIVPGRFLSFCQKAKTLPPDQICVLIIDEINRANLAQVFGELMYLLEYRDEFVSLATGEKFSIPPNVRIIGTMNTADRSIALVDHALRRRFAFLHVAPNYNLLRQYHQTTQYPIEGLIQQLRILNQNIDDHHYEIGPSFFLRSDLEEHLESIWRTEIEPYLEEYFFDQPKKVDQFRWREISEKL